jgi:hypothetical protein
VTEQYTREQKVAEITNSLNRMKRSTPTENHGGTCYPIFFSELDFLLSEIDRLQQEYADERASHNAHMEELLRMQKENERMRTTLRQIKENYPYMLALEGVEDLL